MSAKYYKQISHTIPHSIFSGMPVVKRTPSLCSFASVVLFWHHPEVIPVGTHPPHIDLRPGHFRDIGMSEWLC